MYILNLKTAEIIDHFREDFYSKAYPYLILSTACELKLLKDILNHNTRDYANIWYSTPFAIQR